MDGCKYTTTRFRDEVQCVSMDDAWIWGILSGFAILITGAMIGLAPNLIEKTPTVGWWCVILSPVPLLGPVDG